MAGALARRHVTALDELTAAEGEELGPLLRAVTRALREATGCDKTYLALFAQAEGFAHAARPAVLAVSSAVCHPGCPAASAGPLPRRRRRAAVGACRCP